MFDRGDANPRNANSFAYMNSICDSNMAIFGHIAKSNFHNNFRHVASQFISNNRMSGARCQDILHHAHDGE